MARTEVIRVIKTNTASYTFQCYLTVLAIMVDHPDYPDETFSTLVKRRKIPHEPDWLTGNLHGFHATFATQLVVDFKESSPWPVQQSDLLKPLLMTIVEDGLGKAYNKFGGSTTTNPKHVIVVGAGMAGLTAAYELKRAGHKVTIVETQKTNGGRVKTYHFGKGLYADGKLPIQYPFMIEILKKS